LLFIAHCSLLIAIRNPASPALRAQGVTPPWRDGWIYE